jgi:histone-lysine N-methyltransferase SETMAR
MQIAQECRDCFKNSTYFLRRLVTTDETWVHFYTLETKLHTMTWWLGSKKATMRSAGKVMASDFWDAKCILMVDYLRKGQSINGEYYANLLDRLDQSIRQKRPDLTHQKINFHQDNARPYSCVLVMAKIN